MSAVLLRMLRACHIEAPGALSRARITGTISNADGTPRTEIATVVPPAGAWVRVSPKTARTLLHAGQAEEVCPPAWLKPVLEATEGATTQLHAAHGAISAGLPLYHWQAGIQPLRAVRSKEEATHAFTSGAQTPLFMTEQPVALGRLKRLVAWRDGALIEVPHPTSQP